MPQVRNSAVLVLLVFGALLFAGGCGDPNADAPFDADSGMHKAGWLPAGHAAAAKADEGVSCTECHGSDLEGGISGVSCRSCHVNGSPLELTDCMSCHGNPPSGTVSPNRAGAHNMTTGHFAAQVVLPDGCSTCHKGAGSGTSLHDNGTVNVSLLSSYNAKSGSAAYNANGTCSGVSCHGGQTTPAWLTGKIDVNTQCSLCHSYGTSEYNSYVSGQHNFHVNTQKIACRVCHNTDILSQNHFTSLATPTLEGSAASTVDTPYVTYSGGSCTTVCHAVRSW